MVTFETLGGTVSISDEQIVISESIRRRLRNHVSTDRRVQAALLAGLLVGVSMLLYAPDTIGRYIQMIGGVVAIYLALVVYVRVRKGPQSREVNIDQISKAYLRNPLLSPPKVLLEYSTSDTDQIKKPIVLQNRWQENRTGPNEVLTALQNAGVPVERD